MQKDYWDYFLEGLLATFGLLIICLVIPIFWILLPVVPFFPFVYPYAKMTKENGKAKKREEQITIQVEAIKRARA